MVTRLLVNILGINYKRIGHCYINFIKMFSISSESVWIEAVIAIDSNLWVKWFVIPFFLNAVLLIVNDNGVCCACCDGAGMTVD